MADTDIQSDGKVLRRMFAFAHPHLHLFAISILLSLMIIVFEAIYMWVPASLLRIMFAEEVDPLLTVRPEVSLATLNELFKYWTYQIARSGDPMVALKAGCIVVIVACLLKNVCQYAYDILTGKLNLVIVRDLRNAFYKHITMLPVSFYDRSRSGNIVSKLLNDINEVNMAVTETLKRILVDPFRVVFFLLMLIVIDWKMSLIVLSIYPVLGFGVVKIGQSVRRRSKRMMQNLSGLVSVLNETIGGLRVVKMFNMNNAEVAKFKHENSRFVRSAFRSICMRAASRPLTETLGVFVTGILLLYGGRRVLDAADSFNAEDFIRFIFVLLYSYRPLKSLTQINNALQAGAASGERLFETMDEKPEALTPFDASRVPAFEHELRFDHVSFSYEGHDQRVLDCVSFSVRKGMIIALVGASGSGKTTILDCIPRFYEATEGAIRLDGRDVREFDLVGYRHLFAVVAQNTILFDDSVFNNIAYGVEQADPADVIEVAKGANAWEFIQNLPQGLETAVGERGVMLSGGQCQRIAIARALLRNAPILILDEATSALDTEAERVVQRAINELMKNRTTIIVAHRLSTIRHADLILVLDQGRIIEQGTHAELMERGGHYRRSYDLQYSRDGDA